jgi:hypothetical protein
MDSQPFTHRLRLAIESEVPAHRRFKDLEEKTSINAGTWRQFFGGRQRATVEMISAICERWPQYAFWIATGVSDAEYGHIAPTKSGFPNNGKEQPSSTRLFHELIALRRAAAQRATEWLGIDESDLPLLVNNEPVSLSNDVLRCVAADPTFAADDLEAHRNRARVAAQLRKTEISLQPELPLFDHEDGAAILRAVEISLSKGQPATDDKVEKLNVRIARYQRDKPR